MATEPGARARPEIDYGRRGRGYVFGAFQPATGEAFTAPYAGRTTANWVDFLEQVDGRLPAEVGRVYAILDNLSAHRATDVLLLAPWHPRREFVFQPKYAACLNLIEPWGKVLRSLAMEGHRFEGRAVVCRAVVEATTYWGRVAGGHCWPPAPSEPCVRVSPHTAPRWAVRVIEACAGGGRQEPSRAVFWSWQ